MKILKQGNIVIGLKKINLDKNRCVDFSPHRKDDEV